MTKQASDLLLPVVVVAPPLTGMTVVSGVVVDRVRAAGGVALTVSRKSWMPRPIWSAVKHLALTLMTFRGLLRSKQPLYLVSDSGGGLWGTLLLVALMRAARRDHVLHHHVYSYLNKHRRVMALLVRVGGNRTDHVLLSEGMRLLFVERYRPAKSRFVTNLGIVFSSFADSDVARLLPSDSVEHGPLRLGFLGRLNDEKGLEVLEDLVASSETFQGFQLKIAGPVAPEEKERVETLAQKPGVDYVGPVYDSDKVAFLKSVDYLLFPTQYDREAQPLVIWEAALSGAEILAIDKGAIAEQIDTLEGETCPDSTHFVQRALKIVETETRPSDEDRSRRVLRVAKLARSGLIDLDEIIGKPSTPGSVKL